MHLGGRLVGPLIVLHGFKTVTVGRPKMPNFTRMRRGSCLMICIAKGYPIEAWRPLAVLRWAHAR